MPTCKVCGDWEPPDPETGYDAEGYCSEACMLADEEMEAYTQSPTTIPPQTYWAARWWMDFDHVD